jgi:hypothetical protein
MGLPRGLIVGNILQAAVFGLLSAELWRRGGPTGPLLLVAAGAQLLSALMSALRREALARASAGLSLLAVSAVVGLFAHACLHIIDRFGPEAAGTGKEVLLGLLLALPWVVLFPAYQSLRGRPAAGALLLLPLLLPPAVGAITDRPTQAWEAAPDLSLAASSAWTRWNAGSSVVAGPPIRGDAAAVVLLTPWIEGVAGETVRGDGPTLSAALEAALAGLAAPRGDRLALVLDHARLRYTSGLVAVGRGGGLGAEGGRSPSERWRPDGVRFTSLFPGWSAPAPRLEGQDPTVFDSVLVDEAGPRRLGAGWVAPPPLTAESALQAAIAGGRMLAHNQDADGRYAYTVLGPSGERGRGYNLPRHAGATWFLARLAARTGDAELAAAADRGLSLLVAKSHPLPGGRSFVAEGDKREGIAWVGTTALALLAADLRDHPSAPAWAAFVASAIDEVGRARGNAQRATGEFKTPTHNSYGQGQVMLALARRARAGGDPALDAAALRGAAFLDDGYTRLASNQLISLDEHWACLTALALRETFGQAAGQDLCVAYLDQERARFPRVEEGRRASAGAAGGMAEAVVALAVLDPEGPWAAEALEYGKLFLDSAYQPGDAPFLRDPAALEGGFRDSPWELDVRMDAVQHIGCALLGVEALLSGVVRPGSLP